MQTYLYIGCGTGREIVAAYNREPDHRYIGIDADADAIHRGIDYLRKKGIENIVLFHDNILDVRTLLPKGLAQRAFIYFPRDELLEALVEEDAIYRMLSRIDPERVEIIVDEEYSFSIEQKLNAHGFSNVRTQKVNPAYMKQHVGSELVELAIAHASHTKEKMRTIADNILNHSILISTGPKNQ